LSEGARILVVDDDPRVRSMLDRYLTGEGFHVDCAENGDAMRRYLAGNGFDLVILDLVIPGESGLDLARELRATRDLPVIMLSGKGDLIDRVVGLEVGADDYVTKPFHLREVLARIRSVLRRCAPGQSPGSPERAEPRPADDVVCFDGRRLDLTKRELFEPDGTPIRLTTGEFNLLAAFIRHPNRPLTRDHLLDAVSGRSWAPFDRSIDTQIGRLRRKIEPDPANPEIIKTVRGVGYLFAAKVGRAQAG